jgi:hypothetical protein
MYNYAKSCKNKEIVMKNFSYVFILLFLFISVTYAENTQNNVVPTSVNIGNKTLILNGEGFRKKFFIKVYLGAFYVEKKIKSEKELFDKKITCMIRMKFVYKHINAFKLQKAYIDGIENNTPQYINLPETKQFIDTFDFDVKKGDIIDIIIIEGNIVKVMFNGVIKSSLKSKKLAEAILKVYFGKKPADQNLKNAMLGEK